MEVEFTHVHAHTHGNASKHTPHAKRSYVDETGHPTEATWDGPSLSMEVRHSGTSEEEKSRITHEVKVQKLGLEARKEVRIEVGSGREAGR